jgi:hypothetical protein
MRALFFGERRMTMGQYKKTFFARLSEKFMVWYKCQRGYSPHHFSKWIDCDEVTLQKAFPLASTGKDDVEERLGLPHVVINRDGRLQWQYRVLEYWMPFGLSDICASVDMKCAIIFNFDERHRLYEVVRRSAEYDYFA